MILIVLKQQKAISQTDGILGRIQDWIFIMIILNILKIYKLNNEEIKRFFKRGIKEDKK